MMKPKSPNTSSRNNDKDEPETNSSYDTPPVVGVGVGPSSGITLNSNSFGSNSSGGSGRRLSFSSSKLKTHPPHLLTTSTEPNAFLSPSINPLSLVKGTSHDNVIHNSNSNISATSQGIISGTVVPNIGLHSNIISSSSTNSLSGTTINPTSIPTTNTNTNNITSCNYYKKYQSILLDDEEDSNINHQKFYIPDPKLLPTPKTPSKCPLFCVFYAEFDIIVGPKIFYQSPKTFMDRDIFIKTEEIHELLEETFQSCCLNQSSTTSSSKTSASTAATTKIDPEAELPQHQQTQQQQQDKKKIYVGSDSLSIFDSTSEYIITGNELAGQMISLSTHNMHILARPTIIHNSQYERNSLLFSVGFVVRRLVDPSPFRPLLGKIASTLSSMEIESKLLSNPKTKPHLQTILDTILISLNSPTAECHLILDPSNALHLQYRPTPPKAHPPFIPDHAVPLLLRPEHQLQNMEWDLTINWIVPHINGVKCAKLIAESSEVDAEMVRSCLRVLKHHDVIACVDIFRYTNVYESTPLAQRLLCGKHESLLMNAFDYVWKESTMTENFGIHSSGIGVALTRNNSDGPHPPSSMKNSASMHNFVARHAPRIQSHSSSGGGYSFGGRSPSSMDGRTFLSPIDRDQFGLSHSPLLECRLATYASRRAVSSSMEERKSPSLSSSSLDTSVSYDSFSGSGPSSLPSPLGHRYIPPIDKRKKKIIAKAIAMLYSSCRRGLSFDDLLLSKISESNPNSSVKAPSVTKSLSTRTTDNEDLDWVDIFENIDHRRLVAFGVVHGIIHRVHEYPVCVMDPYSECNTVDETMSVETSPKLGSIGKDRRSSNKDDGLDAWEVAKSMDGTRCDDELSCMYNLSMHELIDFVKKNTGTQVISIYSTPLNDT